MNNKTKTAIASGVAVVGIATMAMFGLNTTDETATQSVTTPIVETYTEEQTEIENSVEVVSLEETETTSSETEQAETVQTYSLEDETETSSETTENDPLAPYRIAVEKDGVLIYYYENVPLDLMPLLIKEKGSNTFDLRNPVAVTDSDISIVGEYIFIQSANGMLYLSQLSHGIVEDERINGTDFNGYLLYLNKSIECYDWLPFKDFAGSLYGNGNSLYVMSVAVDDVTLTIDNMLADNFSGRLEGLTIFCNSELTTLINNANGAYFDDVEFCGTVTYLIENAENVVIDNCAVFAYCNAAIKDANAVTVKNTIIENEMKTALLETAVGDCIIENNIIASIIQGEPESKCGAYVGTLKNEIVLKNNLSQCVIDVPVGYGGHAIGYADYEYQDSESITGNYFESSLTVESEESELFIGNIDYVKITAALNSLEKPMAWTDSALSYSVGSVATTVYNLGLLPDYVTLDSGQDIFMVEYETELADYTEKVERLEKLESLSTSFYEGFYDDIDLDAVNQYAEQNQITQIYEADGRYYFEEPEVPTELTINDVTYSNGNVIIFFNDIVSDKTAIVTLFDENKLLTMSSTNITGETVFVEVPTADEATKVKVMVWDSLGSMSPICEAYEKELIN